MVSIKFKKNIVNNSTNETIQTHEPLNEELVISK